jgi:asparagine synthase (glutamine-hydrolysing)
MAWSVENRVPFLNVALAEFIYSLPEEFLLSDSGTTKLVLRRAMQRRVPQPILNRRDKVGFETPYVSWLESMRSEVERVLARNHDGPRALVAGRLASEAQPFLRGFSLSPHLARRLWAVLTLLLWMEAFGVSAELVGAPPAGAAIAAERCVDSDRLA